MDRRSSARTTACLSLAWEVLGGVTQAVQIDPAAIGSTKVSAVFHGRDVFAPAAAHIAAGMPLEKLGTAVDTSVLQVLELEVAEAEPGRIHGAVVDVDRFGNIRLSARPSDLERAGFSVGTMVEIATTATSIRARRIVAYSDVRRASTGCSWTRGTGCRSSATRRARPRGWA